MWASVSPGLYNIFSYLFNVVVIVYHHMTCPGSHWSVSIYTTLSIHKYQHIPDLIAAVDITHTHICSSAASFNDLVIVVKDNPTNQTADMLSND